jgi:ABC-type dipeptide/oligopeptide/nickel transport system permease component
MTSRLPPDQIAMMVCVATAIATGVAALLAVLTYRAQQQMAAHYRSTMVNVVVAILAFGDYVVARSVFSVVVRRLLGSPRGAPEDPLTSSITFVHTGLLPVLAPLIAMAVTWAVLARRSRNAMPGETGA